MSTAVPAQASIKIGQANMNQSRAKAMSDVNKKRGGFDYIINSMMLVCIVGLSIKIFFTTPPSTDGLTGPANAVIYGYAIVALAILVVRFISYGIHDRISTIENRGNNANDQGGMMGKLKNVVGFVKSFIISMGPSLFVLFILCWNIYLNIHYYTKINKGMVADEFFKLVNGTTFLLVFQVICLFQYLRLFIAGKIDKEKQKNSVQEQSRIAFASYLLTLINLILTGIMTIILEFFSTDG